MPLPALDRMFITSAWLHCVLFGVYIYAMSIRKRRAHWIIPLSCICHFSIATAHNILSLFYALQGLTNPAIIFVTDGSILYISRVTALSMTMIGLYLLNVGIIFLSFYLVWDHNLILTAVMLILEAGHLATAVASWSVVVRLGFFFRPAFDALLKADFILNLVLTICLTSGIAYRLWRAGKDTFGLTGHNAYKPAIYTIIQCGAIYTSSIIVVCALHLSGSPAAVMGDYVGVQVATLTPLLLIVNLSLGVTHGEHGETSDTAEPTFAQPAQPVQVSITQETHTHPDDTMELRPTRRNQSLRTYGDDEKGH
ncbi:hypothetical protein EV702DRAFT_1104532 [Suillus placidus]|uniref:Uncharacterized protein n=1 Tax=Suillus placidus TaxID=48579 RepID=A0A9P6ZVJ9_9AGAM|nr:hypothetical protein EV702DRAFT_1104532 [Suillus placidus]